MQAGYAQMWIAGAASMPHQRFQFDLGMPFLGVVPDEKRRKSECSCNRTKGWADQARSERSVTKPDHWAQSEASDRPEAPNAAYSAAPASLLLKVMRLFVFGGSSIYKHVCAALGFKR